MKEMEQPNEREIRVTCHRKKPKLKRNNIRMGMPTEAR
jgi:hypothetical protein